MKEEKIIKVKDARINRDMKMRQCYQLVKELTEKHAHMKRNFGGCILTYNDFQTTSYRNNNNNCQIDAFLDLKKAEATITIKY